MGLPGPYMMPCPMVGACFLWIAYLKNGLNPARIGPLERLTYISTHAVGHYPLNLQHLS